MKKNMNYNNIFHIVVFMGLLSSCIGPQYEMSEGEKQATNIIKRDCSCNIKVEGDAFNLSEELKTKTISLRLLFLKENLNCDNRDSLRIKSKEYVNFYYKMGDKFKRYHDTIVVSFESSHSPVERMEVVDCWQEFKFPLDSL